MAASNQMPRVLGVGGTRAVPDGLRKRGYLIAVAGFFGIAGARLAGLDRNGAAMGTVLVAVVVTAVMGALVFKGQQRLVQQHLPVVAASARLRAHAVRHRAQQAMHELCGLREELLRLQAARGVAGRHG
jgi:hypothetical protein